MIQHAESLKTPPASASRSQTLRKHSGPFGTAVSDSEFSEFSHVRTRPLDFRLSGQQSSFRPSQARLPPRKTNISRQCRDEVTFQSSAPVPLFRVKNREILVARPRYRAMHYPKTTRFPGTLPSPSTPPPRARVSFPLSLPGRAMRADDYFASALARPRATMGPQNIYFLGPRFVRPSGRSEKGDRLISLGPDNGPDLANARF